MNSQDNALMRAVVLDAPGPASALEIREIPKPQPPPGWVLLRVVAFGLNRSELHTRLGLADWDVTFPRVLGIEATGIIEAAPGTDLPIGSKAVAMVGGMGRSFDGGYAEYTIVPAHTVIPVETELDWARLGALPEVLQTAWGSLPERAEALRAVGVDHVIIDDGSVSDAVRAIAPEGVDGAIELVGAPTLRDTLRACRPGGTACFTGMLSNKWIVEQSYPIAFIPTGVRLTAYGGAASNLPAEVLAEIAEAIHRGEIDWPVEVYAMDDIVRAHEEMEYNRVTARQVVLTPAAAGNR